MCGEDSLYPLFLVRVTALLYAKSTFDFQSYILYIYNTTFAKQAFFVFAFLFYFVVDRNFPWA
jgi:hypothetical protein